MVINHKRADFWLPNFGFQRLLLSILKLYKVCNIYSRSIKSLLGISINGNKFNKGSLEFHNH